ncbi:MAG: hypothetical protein ACRDF9_12445 [Candidatus Limnocylindria bacterium]
MGGVLLAAAGAYILFQPFSASPGTCAFGGISGDFAQAVSMCVASSAPLFVLGSPVGLVSIVAALWMLLPGAPEQRIASLLLAAAILAIVGASVFALATSPTGPMRSAPPAESATPTTRP